MDLLDLMALDPKDPLDPAWGSLRSSAESSSAAKANSLTFQYRFGRLPVGSERLTKANPIPTRLPSSRPMCPVDLAGVML